MILIDTALRAREAEGRPIRVGMIGAGFMARPIANQIINVAPGIRLAAIYARRVEQAIAAFEASCCDNYRYAGGDAAIIVRLPPSCCDQVEQPPDPMDSRWFRIWVEILTGILVSMVWIVDLPRRVFRRRD